MTVQPLPQATTAALREQVREMIGRLLDLDLPPGRDEVSLAEQSEQYDSLRVLDAVGRVETGFGVAVDLVADDLRATFYSVATIAGLVARKQHDAAVLGGSW